MQVLASVAARLNLEAGAPAIPALYFFTDPERVADPVSVAARLPRGAAIVYRHFGARERFRVARGLAGVCSRRGLVLLIAADPELAAQTGAAGVHWPQRLAPSQRGAAKLVTTSAHSIDGIVRAQSMGADACVLSPIFATRSKSARPPLGLFHASQITRAASIKVIALGGINAENAASLVGRSFAGLAAVDALAR